jgi:hypothetical protein
MNRSVQGRPQTVMSFCINWDASARNHSWDSGLTNDHTAPPRPPPQDAMPVESPRFFMKNWLGMVYAV